MIVRRAVIEHFVNSLIEKTRKVGDVTKCLWKNCLETCCQRNDNKNQEIQRYSLGISMPD